MRRGKNKGSIRERKDGRFEVRVTASIDFEIGKAKRISYYTHTKQEAVKKLHEKESVEADNIQCGIDCVQSAIIQRTARSYPPSPTPVNELVLNNGEFVVMVNI